VYLVQRSVYSVDQMVDMNVNSGSKLKINADKTTSK
jgi:hypothetical protein